MSTRSALAEKEKGNQFFKKGDYVKAVECYSQALNLDKENHLLYGNRSQAFINLNMPIEAEKDCNKALSLDDKFVKGYHRRGTARKMLCRFAEALADFKKVTELEPGNKQAVKEIDELENILANKGRQPVKPIFIGEENRCKEPLKTINIEDNRQKTKQQSQLVKKVTSKVPVNSFEFYCDWRELTDDSVKLNYLVNIGPSRFREIFPHSLEPIVFCDILRILPQSGDISFKFQLLLNLSKMERFKTLVLFLEDHEEKILQNLIQEMKFSKSLERSQLDTIITRLGSKYV